MTTAVRANNPHERDLTGRAVLITGASGGIGQATAVALAQRGARLFLAGRSEERHRETLAALNEAPGSAAAVFLPLELGDLGSVRACAARFLELDAPLHVLINNAGLAGSRGLTSDGFERAFGVNHLGHFLLTELLLERLLASAPSRIVNVSSVAHYDAPGIDWQALREPTRSTTGMREYEVSKLCNVLHTRELATRLAGRGVSTYALHPGVIASDIWRNVPWGVRHVMRLFMRSNVQGAATTLHCAASPAAAAESGLYYDDCKSKAPSPLAADTALARELLERSRGWIKLGER
jgi:NAD(P)-dependent dehydrogenase (short-subunit alcohol dehydrogenase family)